jgi:hypothetical protein
VFIPEDLDRELRKYIALKYKTEEKGLLSCEVELAIRNHIAVYSMQQDTQITFTRPNQAFGTSQLMELIKRYFIEANLYVDIPDLIPEKHLDQSIASLRGTDVRTVRKWKKLLVEFGYVKKVGIKQYQIMQKSLNINI